MGEFFAVSDDDAAARHVLWGELGLELGSTERLIHALILSSCTHTRTYMEITMTMTCVSQ